jgi:hypothetical protein
MAEPARALLGLAISSDSCYPEDLETTTNRSSPPLLGEDADPARPAGEPAMTEPEPVIHDAAAVPAAETVANGSNGPQAIRERAEASRGPEFSPELSLPADLALLPEDIPLATVAPPPAEPVIVAPPLSEPLVQMTAVASCAEPLMIPPEPAPAKSAEVEALEDRLHRLEALLTNMADTRQLEERLAERLTRRVEAPVATPAAAPVATPAPAPVATPVPPSDQPAKPNAVMEAAGVDSRVASASWVFFDIVRELQSILHMYGDPRYRLTWSGRILPLVFLALIATSGFWTYPLIGWMPTLLGNLVLKTIDLVPAFCLFKVLTRESRRYRDMVT